MRIILSRKRLVVLIERLLTFLHLAHDAPAIDLHLEGTDRRRLLQRKGVDRFHGNLLTVLVALCNRDLRGYSANLGLNGHAM
jgi:hypothetical protein